MLVSSAVFCDFHTHLHQYEEDEPSLNQIDGSRIITVAASMDIDSYKKTLRMAKSSSFIVPSFGIHPWSASADFNVDEVLSCLENSPLIGETGLDSVWGKDVPMRQQEKWFELILDHCNSFSKYCVIHTKGAEKRVLEILSDFPDAKPVIHWYHGPEKYFRMILDRNYPCTFGCEVRYSRYVRKLLSLTPPDLILSETDNPGSEVWLGGVRRDPLLIEDVVKSISSVKGLDFEEMNGIILENSLSILNASHSECCALLNAAECLSDVYE